MINNYSVRVLPLQAHSLVFGGFEEQMLDAIEAAKLAGVKIDKLNLWNRNSSYEIIHLWGFEVENYKNIYWAKKSNKKIVLSCLLPYENFFSPIKLLLKKLYKGKVLKEIINMVDAFTVVNEIQKKYLIDNYGVFSNKIYVIPNIIKNNFFTKQIKKNKKYVLCVGNICERKKQIILAKACAEEKIPLILVGNTIPGEENCASELMLIIKENSQYIKWYKNLKSGSAKLLKLYSNATIFSLLSQNETQPIALLEAIAMNLPILVSDSPYVKQKYFCCAITVKNNSLEKIKSALRVLLKNPAKYYPDKKIILECKKNIVGQQYKNLYQNLISQDANEKN
jgi:glycosyltransferase involved in cell wall biosynthesis